ncbi:MAG: M48 family metallopeptidase [Anaerolineales bacterium]|nr:M48 family metallopeptidase [Anaerolineales bacterium]
MSEMIETIPASESPYAAPTIDPERQEKAKAYARIRRRLWLVGVAWSGIYAFVWLFSGWTLDLKQFLMGYTTNVWLLVPLFVFGYALPDAILSLPLSYYRGFVLPHKYEMSTQSLKDWIVDQIKGALVGAPLGLLFLEALYWVLRAYPQNWWLLFTGFMLVFSVLLTNLAPILIAPLFNKYIPLGEEHADLEARLLKLAEQAHTRVRGVFKFDMSRRTRAANAALTGIGNSHRIILGDTLIDEFSAEEVETILAHELAHQVHKDIPVGIAISSVATLLGFYLANLAMGWGVAIFGFESVADVAAFPLLMIILGLYNLVTMPLENAYSRWRERRADQYALEATGNGIAYASALTRLANQNLGEVEPERWVVWLLHSHPPLGERIKMAEDFGKVD